MERRRPVPWLLKAIEDVGWRIFHIGYVYQPIKERSHALTDSAHMTGNIVGIYTFRRPPTEGSMPPPRYDLWT